MAAGRRQAQTATRAGLISALDEAVEAGRTSSVEALLGAIADRYPYGFTPEAERALNRAVHSRQWATAAYLADFLADTTHPRRRRAGSRRWAQMSDEKALRDHHQETAGPGERPFSLTDAIVDSSSCERERGAALTVAAGRNATRAGDSSGVAGGQRVDANQRASTRATSMLTEEADTRERQNWSRRPPKPTRGSGGGQGR